MSGWPGNLSPLVFVGFRSRHLCPPSVCRLAALQGSSMCGETVGKSMLTNTFFFFQLDADRDEEEVFCDISMTLDNKLFPSEEPAAGEMKIWLLVLSKTDHCWFLRFRVEKKELPQFHWRCNMLVLRPSSSFWIQMSQWWLSQTTEHSSKANEPQQKGYWAADDSF